MQVNTNADGLNVVGDAANETSLARDPVRPNRLAIGWRQFDSLSSSFREAGFAWSRDGGHTWTNGGVLAEGEFRTDPVLDFDLNSNLYYHSLFGTGCGTATCTSQWTADGPGARRYGQAAATRTGWSSIAAAASATAMFTRCGGTTSAVAD
jgi:hypothetical protein